MKTFNVIIVGCGAIAFRWLDHLTKRDDTEIKAIVETDLVRAQQAKDQYGLHCNLYMSLDEALEKEQCNLVVDLTYVTVHKDIVTKALLAGCDVLGEKPMSDSVESVREILRAVKASGRRYTVMQNRRYIDQVQKIRGIVDSGLMGQCVMINGEIFVAADMGSIRNMLKYPQLQDNNIHIFDQARYMCAGKPVSVYYHSFNPKGSKYTGDAAGVAVFEMDNGCVFSFRGYNGAEGMHTSWDHVWRVCCERGTIVWDGVGDAVYQYADQVGRYVYQDGRIPRPDIVRDQHDKALEDMLDAYKTGRPLMTDCWDNVYSIAMVLASIKSIEESRKVNIEVKDVEPYILLH